MKSPLPKEAYDNNANIYKILANSKRLEVLNLLKVKEMAVEEILKITKFSKANLSQHLALLTLNYEMPRAKVLFRSFPSILATNLLSFVGLSYG